MFDNLKCSAALRIAVCLSLVTQGGCGGPSDRSRVRGKVTLDAQPIDGGNIEFVSLETVKPARGGAVIKGGAYDVPADYGLIDGTYLVRVFWPREITEQPPPIGAPGAPGTYTGQMPEDRVPAKYNLQSELRVEIKQGADNKFDFDLTTR